MRNGREYKKLGEVCTLISDGSHNPPKGIDHSLYRMISSQNVFDDNLQITEDNVRYITESDHLCENKRTKLQKDVVLLTIVGTIGRSCVLKGNEGCLTLQRSVAALHPSDQIMPRYLMHCLIGNRHTLNQEAHGIAQKGIYLKQLSSLSIPLPPKSTQLAIVSELDKVNELIRLKKEQLKDFDNLAQSLFYKMFGDPVENEKRWEVKKLNEIVSDNCSISYGIVQPGDGVENGVPVVRPIDMTKTFVSRKGLKNTTKEISDSYKRTILKGNEILMCVRGTTGLISMATPELQGCNVTRGIAPIECGPTCDKWFVFYQILNPAIQHHIAEYTRGIALKQINMKDVRDIPLCLPPLPLQRLFAQHIEQIEREKSEVQKSIQDLETLLASRMQYWFE